MKIFYGVHCDYSKPPVKRKIVSYEDVTIPNDETTSHYSVTWFSKYEDALWFLNKLSK